MVELRGFIQRAVGATMGTAGPMGELFQFAENGGTSVPNALFNSGMVAILLRRSAFA
jgi:hypothetical protein